MDVHNYLQLLHGKEIQNSGFIKNRIWIRFASTAAERTQQNASEINQTILNRVIGLTPPQAIHKPWMGGRAGWCVRVTKEALFKRLFKCSVHNNVSRNFEKSLCKLWIKPFRETCLWIGSLFILVQQTFGEAIHNDFRILPATSRQGAANLWFY